MNTLTLATRYVEDNGIRHITFIAVNRITGETFHGDRTDVLLRTNSDWDHFQNTALGIEKALNGEAVHVDYDLVLLEDLQEFGFLVK